MSAEVWKLRTVLAVVGLGALTLIALSGCAPSDEDIGAATDSRLLTYDEEACGELDGVDRSDWGSCKEYRNGTLDQGVVDSFEGRVDGYNYMVAGCFGLPEPAHRPLTGGSPDDLGGGIGSRYETNFSIGINDALDEHPQCGDAAGRAHCDLAQYLNYCTQYRTYRTLLDGTDTTPQSFLDDDSDKDGLPDNVDECPFLPNVLHSEVLTVLPCTDSDNDGTVDGIDDCPNNPNRSVGPYCGDGVPPPPPLP